MDDDMNMVWNLFCDWFRGTFDECFPKTVCNVKQRKRITLGVTPDMVDLRRHIHIIIILPKNKTGTTYYLTCSMNTSQGRLPLSVERHPDMAKQLRL
ncbi:hypothetical protein WA026_011268 [Henosepilachna vigintioctopunctata]|uniref:Uncharacterized protein n=1 Tax=Henosepilachna vigintioctopunctata TaxID=420089 RepID=A0AAW1U7E2_9CUCU